MGDPHSRHHECSEPNPLLLVMTCKPTMVTTRKRQAQIVSNATCWATGADEPIEEADQHPPTDAAPDHERVREDHRRWRGLNRKSPEHASGHAECQQRDPDVSRPTFHRTAQSEISNWAQTREAANPQWLFQWSGEVEDRRICDPEGIAESSRGSQTPGKKEERRRILKGCQNPAFLASLQDAASLSSVFQGSPLRYDPRLLSAIPWGSKRQSRWTSPEHRKSLCS